MLAFIQQTQVPICIRHWQESPLGRGEVLNLQTQGLNSGARASGVAQRTGVLVTQGHAHSVTAMWAPGCTHLGAPPAVQWKPLRHTECCYVSFHPHFLSVCPRPQPPYSRLIFLVLFFFFLNCSFLFKIQMFLNLETPLKDLCSPCGFLAVAPGKCR